MKKILFLFLFFFPLLYAFGQELPPFITDSLDAYVERTMKKEHLPGLAVCIIKEGKVVLIKGYGVKEAGKNDRVDENTLFMIGSNTKAFTAVAMSMLQEEGRLSLNDPVTKWLPKFRLDNQLAGEQAIIRDVLSHRIGFKTFQGDFTYWKSILTTAQVVDKMHYIVAPYPFRTIYGYCNAGFVVAGEIIPAASGISWEQFVQDRIFKPLKMEHTLALTRDMPQASNRAVPHDFINNVISPEPFGLLDNLAPAGSICSSVSDMSKWVIMLLNNGNVDGEQIVPAKAISQVWYPHSIAGVRGHPFSSQNFRLYGLGFELDDYNGFLKISHTGGVTGFLSRVIMIPQKQIGIVVLTNSLQNTLYYSLGEEIVDALLGLPYRDYARLYEKENNAGIESRIKRESAYRDTIAMKVPMQLPLDSYTGVYKNRLYGKMEIVRDNKNLRVILENHPNLNVVLEPISGNRFLANFNDPDFGTEIFNFKVENGVAKTAILKVADFLEYDPYEFERIPPSQ